MALPPPEELTRLSKICLDNAPIPFESFNETWEKLKKYAKMAAITAVQTGLQTGVSIGSGVASGVAVGLGAIGSIALFPLGAALGPWLAALAISTKADGIFALHDLRTSAKGRGAYPCTCGKCVENLTYMIDKKEGNVAVMAIGVFTGGLAIIANRLNSVVKSFSKDSKKEKICTSIVKGANSGCLCAIATIMMLCGKWGNKADENKALGVEAIAIMMSSNGYMRLKSKC